MEMKWKYLHRNVGKCFRNKKEKKIQSTFMNTFIVQVKFTDHISLVEFHERISITWLFMPAI